MYILGIWDGHNAGAALIDNTSIIFAADEERFTKRKLEVGFPKNAIEASLKFAGIKPADVEIAAYSTTEFTKALERSFPSMRESYYQFRRRKILKPHFEGLRHQIKYAMTSIGNVPCSKAISNAIISKQLKSMGFRNFRLFAIEHHMAHAATAAYTSPFNDSLVVTLDGLGDGISATLSTFGKNGIERKKAIGAKDSLGIFFEQVTNIVGMRELEDEGKVMAMADYSYPFKFEENRLKGFFSVEGTSIKAKYSPAKQYSLLCRIAWQMPREQFSYMAQQLLEVSLSRFIHNAVKEYGNGDVAMAGGTFSNVKANMVIRNDESIKHWYIFPHMGDGGMALGAAMQANFLVNGTKKYKMNAYLGPEYGEDETLKALRNGKKMKYSKDGDPAGHAAELISKGNYLFWFQGRMEYGPRALGNRSILAPSGSEEVKDKLNVYVKKREWFQPFAPSIVEEDVPKILYFDGKGFDKYMTMAYMVKEEKRDIAKSVMHVDGSARPQMVGSENPEYKNLIERVKKNEGAGIVLNTSFNIHGMPIVMDPEDAVETMKKTRTRYMFINGFFVENEDGV
ncbi:MAG: carbamoyltransferase C-terminal domain-containing protein [Candidatus Micrarchaeaceae archaeon]